MPIDAEELLQKAKDAIKNRVKGEVVPDEDADLDGISEELTDQDVGVTAGDQPDPDVEEDSLGEQTPEGDGSDEDGSSGDDGDDPSPGELKDKDYTQGKQRLANERAQLRADREAMNKLLNSPEELKVFLESKGLELKTVTPQKLIELPEDEVTSDLERILIDKVNFMHEKLEGNDAAVKAIQDQSQRDLGKKRFSELEVDFKELAPDYDVPEQVFPMIMMLMKEGRAQLGSEYSMDSALQDFNHLATQGGIGVKTAPTTLEDLKKDPDLYAAVRQEVVDDYKKRKKLKNQGTETPSLKGASGAPAVGEPSLPSDEPVTVESLANKVRAKIARMKAAGTL